MYKIDKRGNTYSFRYRDLDGIEKRHTCPDNILTRTEAKAEQIKFHAELRQKKEIEKTGKINPETLLWKVFCDKFMTYSKSKKQAPEADQRVINAINKYCNLEYFKEFKREKIREYLALRKKDGFEDNTINRDLHTIKSMWSYATDPEELNLACRNEAKGISEISVELSKRDKYYTFEQIKIIEEKIETPRIKILCWLMLHLALRLKEAVNVRWQDIDYINKSAKIYPFKTKNKNPDPVSVPMDDDLIKFLKTLEHTSEFVCGGDYRDKKSRGSISKIIKERFAELGVGGTAHTCRHTFISHAIMKGLRDNIIMRWARLKKVEMLLVYGHLSPDFKTTNINKIYAQEDNPTITLEEIDRQIKILIELKKQILRQAPTNGDQITTYNI